MRILYAEDEKALSRAVTTVLTKKGGYEVDTAYDGEEALERQGRAYMMLSFWM